MGVMKPGKVRPIAICIIRKDSSILVAEGDDTVKKQVFYRPLGGTIEFSEYSRDTVVRELREEIGAELTDVRYLGTIENIFTYNGQTGHEIVLVYEGTFADRSFYEKESIEGVEIDDSPIRAVWKSLTDFENGQAPLYPDGLLELLHSDW
jgi:8-oxo-dGTP pyrophosphatase MutT (NUDIX family)